MFTCKHVISTKPNIKKTLYTAAIVVVTVNMFNTHITVETSEWKLKALACPHGPLWIWSF